MLEGSVFVFGMFHLSARQLRFSNKQFDVKHETQRGLRGGEQVAVYSERVLERTCLPRMRAPFSLCVGLVFAAKHDMPW